jgi:four helix bundle protein
MAQVIALSEKLMAFIEQTIRLIEDLPDTSLGQEIEQRLLRSAILVGSTYEDARSAASRSDLGFKLQKAAAEMRKTHYWLCLAKRAKLTEVERLAPLLVESRELSAFLGRAAVTVKSFHRVKAVHVTTKHELLH